MCRGLLCRVHEGGRLSKRCGLVASLAGAEAEF